GTDEDRAAMAPQGAAQGMVHALAEVAAPLRAQAHFQAAKKSMPPRHVQLHRTTRAAQRRANQALLQARGARRAQARHEARLHAAGERRASEHDDYALSADRRTRAPGAAAGRRAHREAAAAT